MSRSLISRDDCECCRSSGRVGEIPRILDRRHRFVLRGIRRLHGCSPQFLDLLVNTVNLQVIEVDDVVAHNFVDGRLGQMSQFSRDHAA